MNFRKVSLVTLISVLAFVYGAWAKTVEELKAENDRLKVLMESLAKAVGGLGGLSSLTASATAGAATSSSTTTVAPTTTDESTPSDPLVPSAPRPIIASHGYSDSVKVFHMQAYHWGKSHEGLDQCGPIRCEWYNSFHVKALKENLQATDLNALESLRTTTLSLYNIHYLWEKVRLTRPPICEVNTDLTMAESEESKVRYGQLFEGFKNFDGFSTPHPSADLPRVYQAAFLNNSDLLPISNFSSLIKGASFVASDCHKRDSANANRDSIVYRIRMEDYRVDGLGRCMRTPTGPEGITLPKTRDTQYNIHLKRQVIGRYMFNLAFENSLERGYVTEKPFDALIAGTVPVYLGDAIHLKSLLPHPKAAIFVSDFKDNVTALVEYLKYLTDNETAYEEHRDWRTTFSYDANIRYKPLLENSWYCRVCQWAVQAVTKPHKRTTVCRDGQAISKDDGTGSGSGSGSSVVGVGVGVGVGVETKAPAGTVPAVPITPTHLLPVVPIDARQGEPEPPTPPTPHKPQRLRTKVIEELPRYTPKSAPIITPSVQIKAPPGWERKGVRAENSRQIYYVKNGVLHPVPDLPTFKSLMLVPEQVIVLGDLELENYITGDAVEKVNGDEEALYQKKQNAGFKRFEYT